MALSMAEGLGCTDPNEWTRGVGLLLLLLLLSLLLSYSIVNERVLLALVRDGSGWIR